MKRIRRLVVVLAILVAVGLGTVWLLLDGIVRKGVESSLGRALGSETRVGGASVAPLAGRFSLSDLTIGNPAGFHGTKAFSIGRVGLDADLLSFLGREGHIREISLESPEVVIEQRGGTTNLGELLRRLGGDAEGEGEEGETPRGGGKRFRVERIFLGGSRVTILSDLLPSGRVELRIPDIEITDVGGTDHGPVEVARILYPVLQSLLRGAMEAGVSLPEGLRGVLDSDLEGLRRKLEERVRDEIDDARKGLEGKIGKGARKLLERVAPGGK